VLVSCRLAGMAVTSQHGGRFGGVERAQSLERLANRMEALAVFGGHRLSMGGAGRDELAVYLGGRGSKRAATWPAWPTPMSSVSRRSRPQIPSVTASRSMTNRTLQNPSI
jgi:hypothetical protein